MLLLKLKIASKKLEVFTGSKNVKKAHAMSICKINLKLIFPGFQCYMTFRYMSLTFTIIFAAGKETLAE